MKHRAPQFDLPGAQDAFNLAGQCQHTPQGAKTAPAQPQEQPTLFPEAPRPAQERAYRQSLGRLPGQGISHGYPDGLTFDGEVSFTEDRQ